MSIRKLETYVIDCDNCEEVYANVVEVSAELIESFALRDGWKKEGSGHICPECQELS